MIGIIFIGPPCSGKSTIAKEICKKLDLIYISSGDIARRMAEDNDDIKGRLDSGQMAPEYKMRTMIYHDITRCLDHNRSFVLDGFPRFLEQYEWLINTFGELKFMCVYVNASDDTIYSRYRKRGRSDDGADSFKYRVDYFNANTRPLVGIMKMVYNVSNESDMGLMRADIHYDVYNTVRGWIYADSGEVR
jgi:adenylate kinase